MNIPHDINMIALEIAHKAPGGIGDSLEGLRIAIATAIHAERERCAKFADAWDNPSALRLAAGEMTAQEMRTARAVARGIAAAIRTP